MTGGYRELVDVRDGRTYHGSHRATTINSQAAVSEIEKV